MHSRVRRWGRDQEEDPGWQPQARGEDQRGKEATHHLPLCNTTRRDAELGSQPGSREEHKCTLTQTHAFTPVLTCSHLDIHTHPYRCTHTYTTLAHVFTCTPIYTFMHVCSGTHVHSNTFIHIHVHAYAHIPSCVCIHSHRCTYIYTLVHTCACLRMCIFTNVRAYTHVRAHTGPKIWKLALVREITTPLATSLH